MRLPQFRKSKQISRRKDSRKETKRKNGSPFLGGGFDHQFSPGVPLFAAARVALVVRVSDFPGSPALLPHCVRQGEDCHDAKLTATEKGFAMASIHAGNEQCPHPCVVQPPADTCRTARFSGEIAKLRRSPFLLTFLEPFAKKFSQEYIMIRCEASPLLFISPVVDLQNLVSQLLTGICPQRIVDVRISLIRRFKNVGRLATVEPP